MSQVIETKLTTEQKKTLRYVARLIIKGSKGREQITGRYFSPPYDKDNKKELGCCAIGACLISVGAPEMNALVLSDYLALETWPRINYPKGQPAWDRWNEIYLAGNPIPLDDVIMQLNDKAEWSFRRIAAYLRLVAMNGVVISVSD
jgi:hypothetical protein